MHYTRCVRLFICVSVLDLVLYTCGAHPAYGSYLLEDIKYIHKDCYHIYQYKNKLLPKLCLLLQTSCTLRDCKQSISSKL